MPDGTWDHLFAVDGAYCAVKHIEDTDYVMFRGSVTFLDWMQDFQNLAIPYDDLILGPVHPGARDGVLKIKSQLDRVTGQNIVAVGHSLGALHAALYAGYKAAEGKNLQALVMFGEPKAGGEKLSDEIKKKTLVYSYVNQDTDGHDIVTDVPFKISDLAPYQHVQDPLIPCRHTPRLDDIWLAFRYHHFGHYCHAFGCGSPQALSLPT